MPYNYNDYPPTGIDLGTSNSTIAVYKRKTNFVGAEAINLNCNSPASPLLPSAVFLEDQDDSKNLIVGPTALNYRISHPDMFASSFKRNIGVSEKNIQLGNSFFSSIDLSKEVIKKLLQEKKSQDLGYNPPGIVISVPYNFTHPQKVNTESALKQAIDKVFEETIEAERPKVLGLIPEPVAAAINFTFNNKDKNLNNHNILVFDFGGGTLDVTICKLSISPNEIKFEVLATDGSEKFGGEDIDDVVEGYLRSNFIEEFDNNGLPERISKMLDQQVRDLSKRSKEQLSYDESVTLIEVLKNGKTIDHKIKRKALERLLRGDNIKRRDFSNELNTVLNRLFDKAKIIPESINSVLMIGGSSQIPYVKKKIELKCSKAEFISNREFTEIAVAKGAAIYASYLLDKDHNAKHNAFDKKLSYGRLIFRTTSKLGIRHSGEIFKTVIASNSTVPAKGDETFYFRGYKDFKRTMVATQKIDVYQGESTLISENKKIGEIKLPSIYTHGRELKDIPIKIRFEADENFVEVNIFIPKGDENALDISIKERLKF